jgi:hypothetical protein
MKIFELLNSKIYHKIILIQSFHITIEVVHNFAIIIISLIVNFLNQLIKIINFFIKLRKHSI